jgi:NAD(P)H-hydrate repair Nnr-like enzyme with NAD(P)H-hydrate dehydratase domain
MLLIAGTVPLEGLPLIRGPVEADGEALVVNGHRIPSAQGTGAMINAAFAVTQYLDLDPPEVVVAGDIGRGQGTRLVYGYLSENVKRLEPQVVSLHYCLPVMGSMRRLCEAVERCSRKPAMIADAGSMYAAKAAGLAARFDVFTPDAPEMAFLADPDATHPAYIARHLFDYDISRTPELAAQAYRCRNASKLLLVKGKIDYVVEDGHVVATIGNPDVPELEPIGGTGDTITGLVSAFIYAGLELDAAAIIAARANRMAGKMDHPTPATSVAQIIRQFPAVFKEYLCE